MININYNQLGLDYGQFRGLEINLQEFYKTVLLKNESFQNFSEKLKLLTAQNINNSTKIKMANYSNFFLSYILNNDYNELTSKIIASLYLNDNGIFEKCFMGGKCNFSDYIKCVMAINLSTNPTVKLLLKDQLINIEKDIKMLKHYETIAPDQLLR